MRDEQVFISTSMTVARGLRIAVKDNIDVAGFATTAGCAAVARDATIVDRDAACLSGVRQAVEQGRACIVGKTNLNELAAGADGVNEVFGSPANPTARGRMTGGSSSGSAVAVALGLADVAVGTDTSGSVRIPAACCGTYGLKLSHGRVPMEGVRPLSQSLDSVGLLAATPGRLLEGVRMIVPDVAPRAVRPEKVGRLRFRHAGEVDAAIDAFMAERGVVASTIEMPGWGANHTQMTVLREFEAWLNNGSLLGRPELLEEGTAAQLREARELTVKDEARSRVAQRAWKAMWDSVFREFDVVVLPTLANLPPETPDYGHVQSIDWGNFALTGQINLAGLPSLAMPIPNGRAGPPFSMQIVGMRNGESSVLGFLLEALCEPHRVHRR